MAVNPVIFNKAIELFPDVVDMDWEPPEGVNKHPLGKIVEDRSSLRYAYITGAQSMEEALKQTTTHLLAAISLLENSPKKGAPSDTIFDMMVNDYKKAAEQGREALGWKNKHEDG